MDLSFLAPLYAAPAPVASVYLDTTLATEDAAKEIELRWRSLREELAGQGADEETLRALDGAVGGETGVPGEQGQGLFAGQGELLGAHTLIRPPLRDRVAWLPVPDPLDLLLDLDNALPFVMVAADREGADVYAYNARAEGENKRSFHGATLHLNKVPGGGWAHKQYQRQSEQVWDRNAAYVAQDVEAAVADVSAALVLVGGDVRAAGLLREHVSERTRQKIIDLPSGGRADYEAEASLRENMENALRETAAAIRTQTVMDFRAELRRAGNAVQGVAATADAFRTGQVAKLLLNPDRRDEPLLWGGSEPMEVTTERSRLTDPDGGVAAPASAMLIRAAYGTDADFTALNEESEAAEGVGALLRFQLTE